MHVFVFSSVNLTKLYSRTPFELDGFGDRPPPAGSRGVYMVQPGIVWISADRIQKVLNVHSALDHHTNVSL